MKELLEVVAEMASELHPERMNVIANALERTSAPHDLDLAQWRTSFGSYADVKYADRLLMAWRNTPHTTPKEVAMAVRGASSTAKEYETEALYELVWSGPSTGEVPVRHTEQTLCEVIDSAHQRLFIVSFVAYRLDSVLKALTEAVARGVTIRILLEGSSATGGRINNHDSVQVISETLPDIEIYKRADFVSHRGEQPGAVHAKCAVADNRVGFVTSANLTAAAMERNMELGILFSGGSLPDQLHTLLDSLVESGIVVRV